MVGVVRRVDHVLQLLSKMSNWCVTEIAGIGRKRFYWVTNTDDGTFGMNYISNLDVSCGKGRKTTAGCVQDFEGGGV